MYYIDIVAINIYSKGARRVGVSQNDTTKPIELIAYDKNNRV